MGKVVMYSSVSVDGFIADKDDQRSAQPVVFGSGKRFFGSVDAQHVLGDPDVVIQGDRVLHVCYQVRR